MSFSLISKDGIAEKILIKKNHKRKGTTTTIMGLKFDRKKNLMRMKSKKQIIPNKKQLYLKELGPNLKD
jgi:hypothetical protein